MRRGKLHHALLPLMALGAVLNCSNSNDKSGSKTTAGGAAGSLSDEAGSTFVAQPPENGGRRGHDSPGDDTEAASGSAAVSRGGAPNGGETSSARGGESGEGGTSGSSAGASGTGEATAGISVRGLVTDLAGTPIAGVLVSAGETIATTDESGSYALNGLPTGETLTLLAEREGYTKATESVSSDVDTTRDLVLLPVETASIDFRNGESRLATDDGLLIELPQGSLVTEDGTPVTGPVSVEFQVIDTPEEMLAAPGEPMAVDEAGETTTLETLGMVEIRYSDQEGNDVLFTGSSDAPATIGIPLASIVAANYSDGDELGVYSFDEASGTWRFETNRTVVDGTVIAEVTHFTWWMTGAPIATTDQTCLSGRLVLDDNPPESYEGATAVVSGVDHLFSAGAAVDTPSYCGVMCARSTSAPFDVPSTEMLENLPCTQRAAIGSPDVPVTSFRFDATVQPFLSIAHDLATTVGPFVEMQTGPRATVLPFRFVLW